MKKKDLQSLWIGDKVILKKSGRIGLFEGISDDGKAKIRVKNKHVLSSSSNLELLPEEYDSKNEPLYHLVPEENKSNENKKPEFFIDLHMDVLDPENKIAPVRALDFQVDRCKLFINQSIKHRHTRIKIIHGKGTGLLKNAVTDLLKDFPEVYFTFDIHNGGGTAVWLQYL